MPHAVEDKEEVASLNANVASNFNDTCRMF